MAIATQQDQLLIELRQEVQRRRFEYYRLMWRKFRRNRLAVAGLVFLVLIYLTSLLGDFVSPYAPSSRSDYVLAAPMRMHLIDAEGRFHLRPFVYSLTKSIEERTLRLTYKEDKSASYPVRLFVKGDRHRLLGFIGTDLHLFGVEGEGQIFLLGTDRLGRDMLTRIIYAGRVSLTIGLAGVFLTIFIGSVLGAVSGYYGGWIDNIVQRIIEAIMSLPSIPLWMALAAAIPKRYDPYVVFFLITIILSLQGWTGLGRQIRGMALSLREREFVLAARGLGASDWRILTKHILRNTQSHLIVIATLSIPGMILGETALSFLGLGIQPPMLSWGTLLQQAQGGSILNSWWFVIPAFFVIGTVLCFNFVGDGLRDASDPFQR